MSIHEAVLLPGRVSHNPARDVPRLRPDVVHRDRLVQQLSERPYRLGLVVAPAGFGKTTLVLDWLRQNSLPFAWVTLDASDNEPRHFFTHLARALQDVDTRHGLHLYVEKLNEQLVGQAPPAVLMSALVEVLQGAEQEMALVIDDYHHIEVPELHQAVISLLEFLPERVQLVLISRVDPPFPLARLRLNGDLAEVRERDLRFTLDEARAFFERMLGRVLTATDTEALTSKTEGWIAGLQMAALSLRYEADASTFVRTFSGSHAFVVDYLVEEVLQRQSPGMQLFLLRSSILPRFDARLCRFVTGMDEAPRLLGEAERGRLFLVSLDDRRAWYRYHHLFSELLSERLRRQYPEEWDVLHERASTWFESEGDLASALRHAGEMSSYDRLLLLLERHGDSLLDRSELATFAKWAARIPVHAGAEFPWYLITRAWLHLLTDRFADVDVLLSAAEKAVETTTLPYTDEQKATFRGTMATQRAFLLRLQEKYSECVTATEQALVGPAARSVRNRGMLYFNLGRGKLYLGEMQASLAAFEQAYALNRQVGSWYLTLASMGYLGAIAMQTEGLAAGRARMESSLAFAADAHIDMLPASGVLHVQSGRALYLQDDLDAAHAEFRKALELGERGNVLEVTSNALVGLARVASARSDYETATDLLQEIEVLSQSALVRLFDTSLDIERAWLALQRNDRSYLKAWCASQESSLDLPFTTILESADLLRMQVCLREGAYDLAATIIQHLCTAAGQRQRHLTVFQARLGRVILLAGTGQTAAATELLAELLVEAAPGRMIRPFLEYGSDMADLVEQVLGSVSDPEVCAHAMILMERFSPGQAVAPLQLVAGPTPMFRQHLEDPLTEREQEVLFHLSRSLSYQAIADALFVSHDTVKTHVKHVYAKLGASNRKEALENARRAGFTLADR